jgi:hypothetical protein
MFFQIFGTGRWLAAWPGSKMVGGWFVFRSTWEYAVRSPLMRGYLMRATLPLSALALILSLLPASAMCGGVSGQQAQSSGQAQMCGRPAQPTQAEDSFGLKQSKPQQQSGMGMCPCCRGMASMDGMKMDGMKMDGGDPHKGMDMSPKQ